MDCSPVSFSIDPTVDSDIDAWLSSHDLDSKYGDVLREQECDRVSILMTLQEGDLKDLGITTEGARRKFMNAIEASRNSYFGSPSGIAPFG